MKTKTRKPPEPEPPIPKRLASKKDQAAYYNTSERTIAVWRVKGAPLRVPREMVAWWAKTYPKKEINPGIMAALSKRTADLEAEPTPYHAPDKETPPATTPTEVGFDATHQRMLIEEAKLFARIERLEAESAEHARLKNKEEAENAQCAADALRPQWVRLADTLGQADTRQIRNALQRGDLISRAKIEFEYASLIRAHPELLRHELKAVREQLEPTPPAAVWDARVDSALDKLFRALPEKLLGRAAA